MAVIFVYTFCVQINEFLMRMERLKLKPGMY